MLTDQSKIQTKPGSWVCLRRSLTSRKVLGILILFCAIFSYATYTNQITRWTSGNTSLKLLKRRSPDLSGYSFFLSDIENKFRQTKIDCSAIFAGDQRETKKAMTVAQILAVEEKPTNYTVETYMKLRRIDKPYVATLHKEVKNWSWEYKGISDKSNLNATKDCEWFKRTRGYITSSLTREEADFPIAFSLLVVDKDLETLERLLRMVYRPQNFYCIHVHEKSSPKFATAVKALADCFPDNIRMSSRRVNVARASFSAVEAELVCMEDLWKMDTVRQKRYPSGSQPTQKKRKWKYFINLTGQDFPLKTNYELVKILKAFKGANSQEGTQFGIEKDWWKEKPPHGIIPARGAVHTVLNRATVDFILHDQRAKDFVTWLEKTKVPDEMLFASLNNNPHLQIPGTYNGPKLEDVKSNARYEVLADTKLCQTSHTEDKLCILSTADLEGIGTQPQMFASKFHLQEDKVVIGCLEERLFNNTRDEFMGLKSFNTSFYENQDFVLHQVFPKK